jgi:hypothetical protein
VQRGGRTEDAACKVDVVSNGQTVEEGGVLPATGVDWEPLSLLRLEIKKRAKVWSAGLGFFCFAPGRRQRSEDGQFTPTALTMQDPSLVVPSSSVSRLVDRFVWQGGI